MPGATSIPVEWNFLFILCVELSELGTNPGPSHVSRPQSNYRKVSVFIAGCRKWFYLICCFINNCTHVYTQYGSHLLIGRLTTCVRRFYMIGINRHKQKKNY